MTIADISCCNLLKSPTSAQNIPPPLSVREDTKRVELELVEEEIDEEDSTQSRGDAETQSGTRIEIDRLASHGSTGKYELLVLVCSFHGLPGVFAPWRLGVSFFKA